MFNLTRYELLKSPRPPLRSLLNLAAAEALASAPRLRSFLIWVTLKANAATVDIVDRLETSVLFSRLKEEALGTLVKENQDTSPNRVAFEVDALLRVPKNVVEMSSEVH